VVLVLRQWQLLVCFVVMGCLFCSAASASSTNTDNTTSRSTPSPDRKKTTRKTPPRRSSPALKKRKQPLKSNTTKTASRKAAPAKKRPGKATKRPSPQSNRPQDLNMIVVTGSRSRRKLKDTVVRTEVLTRKQIKKTAATQLSDLLQTQLGIQLNEVQGGGTSIVMQGLGSKHILILVDGQRLNGRMRDVLDLSRFPLERIERIEIVKGAGSALYGSDALGGVINIITRKPKRKLSVDVNGRYGNGQGNLFDLTAGLGFKRKGWSGQLNLGWHQYDAFDWNPADKATSGSSTQQIQVDGNVGYRFSRKLRLRLRGQYLFQDRAGVDSNSVGGVFDRQTRTETTEATFSLRAMLPKLTLLNWTAHMAYFRNQNLYKQRNSPSPGDFQENVDWIGQTNLQVNKAFGLQHLLTGGLVGLFEYLRSPRLKKDQTASRLRGSLFVQYEWIPLDGPPAKGWAPGTRFSLVPGFRAEFDSLFGPIVSPKLALRYDPIKGLIFRASYGYGYRAPSFKELFLEFENNAVGYVVTGNDQLRPETSHSIQAGVEWRQLSWLSLRANFFRNDLDNLITERLMPATPGQPQRFTYTNIATALTTGVESMIQLHPSRYFTLHLGYTYTHTADKATGLEIPNRAAHQASAQLIASDPWIKLRWTIRGTFVGERTALGDFDGDGVDERRTLEPYTLLHARVSRKIWKLEVYLAVQNILNVGNHEYLPIRPRTFMGGVRGSW
jgi:outer membrane receptor for ferrienterochelin and colicins